MKAKIDKYKPCINWYSSIRQMNSPHGIRHAMRTIAYLSLLTENNPILYIATALHDIARAEGGKEKGHGMTSAEWFIANLCKVARYYKRTFTYRDIRTIYHTIFYHEIPYPIEGENFLSSQNEIALLKTADALDRYRFEEKEFWLVDTHLEIIPKQNIKNLAFDISQQSEKNYLKTKDNYQSIIDAINTINYHQ